MNTLTTLPASTSSAAMKTLLSQEGVTCQIADLSAGERLELGQECRRVLFVLNGEITCTRGAVNTIINTQEAFLTSPERSASLEARNEESARVLVVEIPNGVSNPEIHTFQR